MINPLTPDIPSPSFPYIILLSFQFFFFQLHWEIDSRMPCEFSCTFPLDHPPLCPLAPPIPCAPLPKHFCPPVCLLFAFVLPTIYHLLPLRCPSPKSTLPISWLPLLFQIKQTTTFEGRLCNMREKMRGLSSLA